tara:strand:+ start:382 stop:576 length:195 start_codon:yes stop_codon:yes gene_type:complete
MQLTNQAMGAVMIALQQSLMTQTDIVPVLQSFVFSETDEGLIVENPPILEINNTQEDENSDADV